LKRHKLTSLAIAFEPRHPSWFSDPAVAEIQKILKKKRMGLVFAHSSVFPRYEPEDENVFSDFVYVRFHGPREFAASQYGKKLLSPWAELIREWLARGLTVFAYFNDDAHGYAVKDADILRNLVEI
jgi:uncharacterized protein YecE (DUF72 family)